MDGLERSDESRLARDDVAREEGWYVERVLSIPSTKDLSHSGHVGLLAGFPALTRKPRSLITSLLSEHFISLLSEDYPLTLI